MITAFSTASSNATLPTALRVAEEKLQAAVARQPLRADARLDRQPERHRAVRGRHGALPGAVLRRASSRSRSRCVVLFICILGGIGTAGVPAGSIPVVAMILGQVDVPVEGIGDHPRRRPLPRHVPHDAERDRRPRRGGRGVARRSASGAGRPPGRAARRGSGRPAAVIRRRRFAWPCRAGRERLRPVLSPGSCL